MLYNLEPKKRYEVIIVGAGGHGLATAYYLSKNHNVKDIAVIEKGWLGEVIREEIQQLSDLTIFRSHPLHYMKSPDYFMKI